MGDGDVSEQNLDEELTTTPLGGANPPEAEPLPEPLPEMVPVTRVGARGASVVVECVRAGRPLRALLPGELVPEGVEALSVDLLDEALVISASWEDLAEVTVTPERIAEALRRQGIWSAEDLAAHPAKAQRAFATLYGQDLAQLIRKTR